MFGPWAYLLESVLTAQRLTKGQDTYELMARVVEKNDFWRKKIADFASFWRLGCSFVRRVVMMMSVTFAMAVIGLMRVEAAHMLLGYLNSA